MRENAANVTTYSNITLAHKLLKYVFRKTSTLTDD